MNILNSIVASIVTKWETFTTGPDSVNSLTFCMIISHIIGDWFIQTEYQANNKAEGKFLNKAILTHCGNYTLAHVPTVLIFGLSPLWLVYIFLCHLIIDRRSIVFWIRQNIGGNSIETIKNTSWITITMDQSLHFFTNVVPIFWFIVTRD